MLGADAALDKAALVDEDGFLATDVEAGGSCVEAFGETRAAAHRPSSCQSPEEPEQSHSNENSRLQ